MATKKAKSITTGHKTTTVGIVYLLTQANLAARLVVSIFYLRQWYDGPITLFTTRPESSEIGELCRRAPELRVVHEKLTEAKGTRYQSAYLTKAKLAYHGPYKFNVFLDADTLVVDDISLLMQLACESKLVVTNFLGRTTSDLPFSENIKSWRRIGNLADDQFRIRNRIDQLLQSPMPAINTGVMAFERSRDFANDWTAIASMGSRMITPDEVGLQLLLLDREHQMLNQEFNLHPWAYSRSLRPRIWHFACNTHLVPSGLAVWKSAYDNCRINNIANLQAWSKLSNK